VSEPSFVITRDDRDADGKLQSAHLAELRRVLAAGGIVLLPSDTAYSVATWLRTERTRRQVNELLGRENDEPLSLAFPSTAVVKRWTTRNAAADELLERFTPGPITVVRTASRLVPVAFTRELCGSLNHTLGVRIPNSAEERDVAGLGSSVITTTPVRDLQAPGKPAVKSFAAAITSIRDRIAALDGAPWCAVEGEVRYSAISTVVEVLGRGRNYWVKREGAIHRDEIRACIERSPQ
jgi:L-threonylcarbamoyladenylate synthase